MVSTVTTIGGYTAIAGLGIVYWIYARRPQGGRQAPRQAPSLHEKQEQGKQTARAKRRSSPKSKDNGRVAQLGSDIKDAASAAVETVKETVSEQLPTGKKGKKDQKKENKSTKTPAAAPAPAQSSATTSARSEEDDNRAFAAQLAKAQQGVKMQAPEKSKQKVRTTKQGKANKVADELASATQSSKSSNTPSTSGADGDDDLSSHASPELDASNHASDPTGVADMLEAAAPVLSTLRITPSEKPQQQQKPKPAKKEQEVETKKQRQRRKKNEERKAQDAENEKVRKAQLERQLKTARTLEGTAKSHVSKFNAPPPTNAWNSANGEEPSTSTQRVEVPAETALLDTFDTAPITEPPTSLNERGPSTNGSTLKPVSANVQAANNDQSSSDQNGEWEKVPDQILDEGWENATSKKSKKNQKKAAAAMSDSA